jgi:hypothetical protein
MSPADWRQLIAAYLDGRLSAHAFQRRFLEAYAAATTVPAGVQRLYFVVEAYGGDPIARGHAVSDDDDLFRAAHGVVEELSEHLGPEHVEPRLEAGLREGDVAANLAAAQTRARRAAFTMGTVGTLGCAAIAVYVAIGILQFFAVSDQIQSVLAWSAAPAALVGLLLAFIPVVGSLIAFFGAKDVWLWPWPVAAGVFLAFPAITYAAGWLGHRRGLR